MNIVVLLAGGIGKRMKSSIPKQHLVVTGHQIIEYTLTAFCTNKAVDKVLVVSNPEYIDTIDKLRNNYEKLNWVIAGGNLRALSVYNAILFLNQYCTENDKVIISDAVRPCITYREVKELLDALDYYKGATTGVETYETILHTTDGKLNQIIPREGIIRQTSPEAYKFGVLKKLYLDTPIEKVTKYNNIGIDQMFDAGEDIGIVKSTAFNFKITTQEDLFYFDTVLKKGFDTILNEISL